ncbi:MAG: TraB/GumN family protein [Paludibacter sp.]|nr:TraB/GumN family protein [Paludibacter sp.]
MKNLFVAVLALCFTFGVNAQLLWKVSGNGLSKPSYLFGTHHLIEKEQIKDFDKILALIPQTDVVVGEMDLSDMLGMQLKMLKVAMMKDSTMKQLLNSEDYELVDNQLNQVVGMGLGKLGKIKPMMLSTLYEVKLYMNQNNLKKEPEAIDQVFQKAGKKAKKKIIGLETVEQQMDILFNSSSLKHQAEQLVDAVKNKDKSLDMFKQLNDAYLAGDLKKMSELSIQGGQMTVEDKKIMVDDRNNNWIAQLKTLMPKQSCFVAVGCLHLADEIGLIQQLRNAGLTVEAIDKM